MLLFPFTKPFLGKPKGGFPYKCNGVSTKEGKNPSSPEITRMFCENTYLVSNQIFTIAYNKAISPIIGLQWIHSTSMNPISLERVNLISLERVNPIPLERVNQRFNQPSSN